IVRSLCETGGSTTGLSVTDACRQCSVGDVSRYFTMSELVCRGSDFHCFVFGGLMHSFNSGRPCLPTRALRPPRTDTVTRLTGSSRQARNSRGPSFVFCQPMPNNDGQPHVKSIIS